MAKWQRGVLTEVVRKLSNYETGARFSMDAAKDKEVKAAIKLWLATWMVQPLQTILDADAGKAHADAVDYFKRQYR